MKELMISLLSIGLSYAMKSDLTGDNQPHRHFNDGSDSPQYFALKESNCPFPCSEPRESNFQLTKPDREKCDLDVFDVIFGDRGPLRKSCIEEARQEPQEAESLPKPRIAEESQASQAEKSVSSKRKNPDKINLNKAEQEVREAITNSNPYDLKSIAKKHNVLLGSLRRKLQAKGFVKKRKYRLSRKEHRQCVSLALSEIKALSDANKSVVWARIARKFTVHASTLASYCNRIKTSFDDTQLKQ